MSVHSRNYDPNEEQERARRGSALYSRRELAKGQTTTERFVAFLFLALSFIGATLFGGGGVEAWLKVQPNLIGAGSAFAVQCLCTRIQWIYAAQRWRSPWWLITFGLSTAGTLLGFWGLVHAPVAGALQAAQVPEQTAGIAAGILLTLAAGLLDYIPEQTLTY